MIEMTPLEENRWQMFRKKHKKAYNLFYEVHPTGIGDAVIAVAVYKHRLFPDRRVENDITDYSCW